MHNLVFFFDTYALFEVVRGNQNYSIYQDAVAITTIFNLAEFNYGLKKEVSELEADKFTEKFSPALTSVTIADVKEAMSLKLKNKALSIPDVIGYTVAKRLGIKFLTGDEGFKNMPEVEFIKK
ncbi:PIN domain-containing protein [Candidatus Woesearchaeota archaeon]|nr:PIN domain-containing protein [Candidatus Woesearchaeota archaeon]